RGRQLAALGYGSVGFGAGRDARPQEGHHTGDRRAGHRSWRRRTRRPHRHRGGTRTRFLASNSSLGGPSSLAPWYRPLTHPAATQPSPWRPTMLAVSEAPGDHGVLPRSSGPPTRGGLLALRHDMGDHAGDVVGATAFVGEVDERGHGLVARGVFRRHVREHPVDLVDL